MMEGFNSCCKVSGIGIIEKCLFRVFLRAMFKNYVGNIMFYTMEEFVLFLVIEIFEGNL